MSYNKWEKDVIEEINNLHKQSTEKYLSFAPVKIENCVYFDNGGCSYEDRKQILSKITEEVIPKESKILDVGCNTGTTTFILSNLFPTCEITGIDIDKLALKCANVVLNYYNKFKTNTKITFNLVNLFKYKGYNNYNIIINSNIDNTYAKLNKKLKLYKKRGFKGTVVVMFPFKHKKEYTEEYKQKRVKKVLEKYNSFVIRQDNIDKELIIIKL